MATLAEHVRRFDNDSDDSKSNISSVSSVRIAQSCPCCKKDIQARFMFNHLRKLHPEFVKSMYGVWKESDMDELIKTNAPFPVEWTSKDDFDEDIITTLWGCLGCNNTYTTEHNATKHCLGKCKKEHNVNLRRIKKEEQMDKEKHEKKLSAERKRWLNRTPAQIHSCIQQNTDYYNKKWIKVGSIISRYLCTMNHKRPQDYIFFDLPCPDFEDDKKKMEQLEIRVGAEFTKWKRKYEDILPNLWGATDVVSHSDYEVLEKMIMHFQDYEPKF
jgi:hypothetical protein